MRDLHVKSAAIEGDAAALYFGDVMHARLKPVGPSLQLSRHELADRPRSAGGRRPANTVVRRQPARLYSFHEADHGERDGSSLRLYAQRCAAEHGIDLTGGRVLLLCYPRLFGYTFNPLSVYFCYRADGQPALLIYEVRNTFGDIHAYVLPVKSGDVSPAGIRQTQDKRFYVSPFVEMAMRYHFRVTLPSDGVKLRILETDGEGPLLSATFNGHRRSLNTQELLRSFLSLPLVTLKVVAAIHWEALRLWLKGVRLVPRPGKAADESLATEARSDYISTVTSAHGR